MFISRAFCHYTELLFLLLPGHYLAPVLPQPLPGPNLLVTPPLSSSPPTCGFLFTYLVSIVILSLKLNVHLILH